MLLGGPARWCTILPMRIWALSDLHLSLGGDKPMDVFGEHWRDHHVQMAASWDEKVAPGDIVLSPGDFSWAGKPNQATADFAWLAERPGRKVLIKGNHDHWWPKSKTKLAALLPEQTWALKKHACVIDGVALFGARGGDFAPLTRYGDKRTPEQIEAALEREEAELKASIEHLEELRKTESITLTICLFHYPPLPPGSKHSRFTPWISHAGASYCIYGHLHGSEVGNARFEGEIDGVQYRCASCDQIGFEMMLVAEV